MNKEPEMYNGQKVRIDSDGYKYAEGYWVNKEQTYIHQAEALKKYNLTELPKKMSVHHINMNKLDNSWDNLMLISDSDHKKLHNYIKKHPEVIEYNEEETKQLLDKIREDIEEKTGDPYDDAKIDLKRLLLKRKLYKKDPSYMTNSEIDELENKIKNARFRISEIRAERAKSRKPKPDKDTLLMDLEKFRNFEKMADYYGVSSNAIRKWCKTYDIDFHKYSHTDISPKITKICPTCGKEFTCTEKQNKTYCSRECMNNRAIKDIDDDEIKYLLKDGWSVRRIASYYCIHHNTLIIYMYKHGIDYHKYI